MNKSILTLWCLLLLFSCSKRSSKDIKPITTVTDTTKAATIVTPPISTGNYHADGDVNKLYDNNPNGVNIVILGDGFVKDDLLIGGNFDKQVKQTIDYLFTVPPYNQNKLNFNTYVVYAESKTRGAAKGYVASNTNTTFNSYFDPQIDRLLIVGNTAACSTYVKKAIPAQSAHLVIMIVNDQTYGGSGGSVAVLSVHPSSKYVMVHEIGHTFAGLGDEYVDLPNADRYSTAFVPGMANIDNTNNLTNIKWARFANLPAYQSQVGAYEGAYFRASGYYRPEAHSIMETLSYATYNAPSREAIVKRIDLILGVPYDFNAFLTSDALSVPPIKVAGTNPVPAIPQNDFINMKERIQQLQNERKQ